jgi:hypothetical protein
MRITIQKLTLKDLEIGIAYLTIMAIGFFIITFFPKALNLITPCLFRAWTGIPCPACGGTHSAIYLAHLQLYKSFIANPFVFLLLLVMFFWGVNVVLGIIIKKNFKFLLSTVEKKQVRITILLVIPLSWVFLIVKTFLLSQKGL